MTKEEWAISDNAQHMLKSLHREQPNFLITQIPQLHKFLIDCCWKNKHLIPQHHLRNGLRGAEKWLAGKITDAKLYDLNWHAEAEAFAIDYAKTDEEIRKLKELISGIPELNDMPYSQARELIKKAAYFAEGTMIYSKFRKLPWINYLLSSPFLCPDILRTFLEPEF